MSHKQSPSKKSSEQKGKGRKSSSSSSPKKSSAASTNASATLSSSPSSSDSVLSYYKDLEDIKIEENGLFARSPDDGIKSHTMDAQQSTEKEVLGYVRTPAILDEVAKLIKSGSDKDSSNAKTLFTKEVKDLLELGQLTITGQPILLRDETIKFIMNGMKQLPEGYISLDASRPWLCFWMLHTLSLLDAQSSIKECAPKVINTLSRCWDDNYGGFGGGIQHLPHTAPTYAAVMALVTIGTPEALKVIDRSKLYKFFMSLKNEDGGFRVQYDGEADARALYTVLAVSSLLNIMTPELTHNCAEWVGRCQTFEGGFGGEPGNEAHGGYAFCCLASLCILNRFDTFHIDAFRRWICQRQMSIEGGFQGRTNKLVDSCYSYWQGAIFSLLKLIPDENQYSTHGAKSEPSSSSSSSSSSSPSSSTFLMDSLKLQSYVMLACGAKGGGFKDKPGKSKDFYHTAYALAGVSIAQHGDRSSANDKPVVIGDDLKNNTLQRTDPIYNVVDHKLEFARKFFSSQ